MVSKTFLNLTQAKKDKILSAAKKEFSRVPLDKALISNIVRTADIPRGSFYQYFSSLDDLFIYLLETMYGTFYTTLSNYLEKTDNNFFLAYKLKFKDTLNYFDNGENKQFNLNIYQTLLSKTNNDDFFNVIIDFKKVREMNIIPPKYQDNPYIEEAIGLISMVNYSQLNRFVIGEEPKNKVYKDYCDYLDYIETTLSTAAKEDK